MNGWRRWTDERMNGWGGKLDERMNEANLGVQHMRSFPKKGRFPTYFDKKCGQKVVVDPRDQPSSFLAPLGVYFGGGEN